MMLPPGRPDEVDSDQTESLSEMTYHLVHQRYTMWEMTDILKLSKSIMLLVKMKNVSFILQKN